MTIPTCRSCGVPFADHLGLQDTCERLAEMREHRDRLKVECEQLRSRFVALAAHYARQSCHFPDGDIRGPMMAQAAQDMRDAIELELRR